MNKIHYNPKLKELTRKLRNNSTKAEIKLWNFLKGKRLMGYDFHSPLIITSQIFSATGYCWQLK